MAWRGRPEAGELALPALALALALALAPRGAAPCRPGHRAPAWHRAVVGLEYVDPRTNRTVRRVSKDARFDGGSLCEPRRGLVGVPRAPGGDPGGCAPDTRFLAPEPGAPEPWVALVARGGCPVRDRVLAAARGNASALVVYGKDRRGDLAAVPADAGARDIVVIMVSYSKGREILNLVQKGILVKMIIECRRKEVKKVISQLPLHTVKHGEKGIDVDAENCVVCIENFKVSDVTRILPCKHIFHSTCVDPWLLDHGTCPVCKLDVIKALRYWREPEDGKALPTAESDPGSVSAEALSVAFSDEDRSSSSSSLPALSSSSSPTRESASAHCLTECAEDTGGNTALLGDLKIPSWN